MAETLRIEVVHEGDYDSTIYEVESLEIQGDFRVEHQGYAGVLRIFPVSSVSSGAEHSQADT